MPQEILEYVSSHAAEMTADLRALVEIESPSDDQAALGAALDWIAAAFGRSFAGEGPWSVTVERLTGHPDSRHSAGDQPTAAPPAGHLAIRFGPRSEDKSLLLLAHTDTVWPIGTLRDRPFRIESEKVYGPGSYDMKGGIVLALWAMKALREAGRQLRRPVTLLVNTDEEIGSASSRPYIEDEARHSSAVLVLEPALPDGSVKTWRKGVGHFRVEVAGVAAHAGADPRKGVSAIGELAAQILRLHGMTDFDTGTTVNVGRIGGGLRSNVVADSAWGEVDVRVMSKEEAGRIEKAMHSLEPALPGASLKAIGAMNRPPMERNEGALALYARARDVAAGLGFELGETGTGGASDGNFTSAVGTPTLDGLGVVGDGAHAVTEFVDLKTMPLRAALLAGLIADL